MPVLLADRGEPGVVVGHVGPLAKECVKAPVVGEVVWPAVAQVPLAYQMRLVSHPSEMLR